MEKTSEESGCALARQIAHDLGWNGGTFSDARDATMDFGPDKTASAQHPEIAAQNVKG